MSRPPKHTPAALAKEVIDRLHCTVPRVSYSELAVFEASLMAMFEEKFPPRTRKPKAEKTT